MFYAEQASSSAHSGGSPFLTFKALKKDVSLRLCSEA